MDEDKYLAANISTIANGNDYNMADLVKYGEYWIGLVEIEEWTDRWYTYWNIYMLIQRGFTRLYYSPSINTTAMSYVYTDINMIIHYYVGYEPED